MNKNIFIVWIRIGDYHLSRINAVKRIYGKQHVFSADIAGSDSLYKWNTGEVENHFILSDKPAEKGDFFNRFRNYRKVVKEHNIKYCCLAGYGRKEFIAYIIWSKLTGRKVLLFSESWYGKKSIGAFFKKMLLNLFVDKMLVSGINARDFAINILGQKKEKVAIPYSVVDNNHFKSDEPYNPQNKIMLCMARFSPEKNQERLIEAFLQSDLSKTWKLKLVGAGPDKEKLENLVKDTDKVIISNWADYNTLPSIYKNSSFFVLASIFEPWGLVVNEAMSAGLPVACASVVGCKPDLVTDKNGFVFDSFDTDSIKNCFDKISKLSDEQLVMMSDESKKIIENFTPEVWANKLLELLEIKHD